MSLLKRRVWDLNSFCGVYSLHPSKWEVFLIFAFLSSHVWPAHFIAKMKVASLMVENEKYPVLNSLSRSACLLSPFAHGAIRIHPVSYSWSVL